jgi:hypothetical protein
VEREVSHGTCGWDEARLGKQEAEARLVAHWLRLVRGLLRGVKQARERGCVRIECVGTLAGGAWLPAR